MKALLAALLLALLAACGGGDPEDECVTNFGHGTEGREGPQWRMRCPAPEPGH